MADWSAAQYLRFADERTRAARDLLAQVPLTSPARVVDLGCGPGNSTELLVERFPDATITGIDSSPDMLDKARRRLPGLAFEKADATTWQPHEPVDLIFANALFQWVPDHLSVLERLVSCLAPGGVLAIQVPDNLAEPSQQAMRDAAASGPWADKLSRAAEARDPIPPPQNYYDRLKPHARRLDIWHTAYHHVVEGHDAVVEWVKGTGLLPFLAPLDGAEREAYLATYRGLIARSHPLQFDGTVLLRYPRLFLVAAR